MWLAIQIAAGIVLAYVIIRNGLQVWRYSVGLLAILAILAVYLFIGTTAFQAVESYGGFGTVAAKVLHYAGLFAGIIAFFAAIYVEGFALKTITNRLFNRDWQPKNALWYLGGLNFFFTMLALSGFSLTNEGPILGPLDQYGRANGWDDGLVLGVCLLVSLWVVPLGYWANSSAWQIEFARTLSDKDPS